MHSSTIVLLGRDGRSTRVLFHALTKELGPPVAVLEPAPSRWILLRRRAARYGVGMAAGQVLFLALLAPWLAVAGRRRVRQILDRAGLSDTPIPAEACRRVPSANSQETISLLRELRPSVVVVSGARVLAPAVFEATGAPFLNVHAGITPAYRGVHGGYWALVRGDREHCGVTVHCVDEGIDTGPIIAQALIDPTPQDNFATYPVLQLAAGVPLLVRAVARIVTGEGLVCRPSEGRQPSRYWTHPTLWSYLRDRVR